jgi:hypothetical protein
VGKEGIKVDPKKIETVAKWRRPLEVGQLRLFLGLCNYFRRFIHGVVSFWFFSKQQNPGNNVSRKTELVSIRVNVTLG